MSSNPICEVCGRPGEHFAHGDFTAYKEARRAGVTLPDVRHISWPVGDEAPDVD